MTSQQNTYNSPGAPPPNWNQQNSNPQQAGWTPQEPAQGYQPHSGESQSYYQPPHGQPQNFQPPPGPPAQGQPQPQRTEDLGLPQGQERTEQVEYLQSFEATAPQSEDDRNQETLQREFPGIDGSLIAAIYGDSKSLNATREMLQALKED